MKALEATSGHGRISEEQVERAVELIRVAKEESRTLGNVLALRQAGVPGSKGEIRQAITAEVQMQLDEARGHTIETVRDSLWKVATDTDHPHWDRANARLLKAYDPLFRDVSRHELTGRDGGPVELLAGRFDPDQLSVEELEQVRGLLEKARPAELHAA